VGIEQSPHDEKPWHNVRTRKGFEMSGYEVTQAQWKAVKENNHRSFDGPDQHYRPPVASVAS
jgi:formylglycine-generating enzyme required for sulfatase activity